MPLHIRFEPSRDNTDDAIKRIMTQVAANDMPLLPAVHTAHHVHACSFCGSTFWSTDRYAYCCSKQSCRDAQRHDA